LIWQVITAEVLGTK